MAARETRRGARRGAARNKGRDDAGGRWRLSYAPFSVAHLRRRGAFSLTSFIASPGSSLVGVLVYSRASYRIRRRGGHVVGGVVGIRFLSVAGWRCRLVSISHSRGVFISVGIRGSVCFSPCRFAGGIGAPFLLARSSALFRGGVVSSCVSSPSSRLCVSLSVPFRLRCLPWCPVRHVRRLVLLSRVAARSPLSCGRHGVRFCLPSRRVVSSVMPCVVSMGVSSGVVRVLVLSFFSRLVRGVISSWRLVRSSRSVASRRVACRSPLSRRGRGAFLSSFGDTGRTRRFPKLDFSVELERAWAMGDMRRRGWGEAMRTDAGRGDENMERIGQWGDETQWANRNETNNETDMGRDEGARRKIDM